MRKVISSNNAVCTMQITDTAGSHQFPAMQRLSISKGHAFIMVFSISSRQSLEELKPILELINEVSAHIYIFILIYDGRRCCFSILLLYRVVVNKIPEHRHMDFILHFTQKYLNCSIEDFLSQVELRGLWSLDNCFPQVFLDPAVSTTVSTLTCHQSSTTRADAMVCR